VSPKPSGEALLGDDVRAALKRVDDHGVLLGIVHRQQRQVDAAAHIRRQSCQAASASSEHLGAFRVVRDRADVRSRQQEVRFLSRVHVLGERGDHSQRILEGVPTRDLREQRTVEGQLRSSTISAWRSTKPTLPSRRSKTARCRWCSPAASPRHAAPR
jgi:hypothetical protein